MALILTIVTEVVNKDNLLDEVFWASVENTHNGPQQG